MKQGKTPSEQDLKQGFTRGDTGFGPDHFTTDAQKEKAGSVISPRYEEVRDRSPKTKD
jgi:hypothetical protein